MGIRPRTLAIGAMLATGLLATSACTTAPDLPPPPINETSAPSTRPSEVTPQPMPIEGVETSLPVWHAELLNPVGFAVDNLEYVQWLIMQTGMQVPDVNYGVLQPNEITMCSKFVIINGSAPRNEPADNLGAVWCEFSSMIILIPSVITSADKQLFVHAVMRAYGHALQLAAIKASPPATTTALTSVCYHGKLARQAVTLDQIGEDQARKGMLEFYGDYSDGITYSEQEVLMGFDGNGSCTS